MCCYWSHLVFNCCCWDTDTGIFSDSIFLQMFSWSRQWNKFENRWICDEVKAYEVKAYEKVCHFLATLYAAALAATEAQTCKLLSHSPSRKNYSGYCVSYVASSLSVVRRSNNFLDTEKQQKSRDQSGVHAQFLWLSNVMKNVHSELLFSWIIAKIVISCLYAARLLRVKCRVVTFRALQRYR